MSEASEIVARIERALAATQRINDRCDNLEASVSRLNGLPATLESHTDASTSFSACLHTLKSEVLPEVRSVTNAYPTTLDEVAVHVQQLVESAHELPQRLQALATEHLKHLHTDLDDRLRSAINHAEAEYTSIREKLVEMLDSASSKLHEEAEEFHSKGVHALSRTSEAVSEADRDVRRILQELQKIRHDILAACRAVGIGIDAVKPAMDAAVSAFSSVG
jgi:ElaB/YqjD/DUF883 family membrane-anchored ribosome-binding protein